MLYDASGKEMHVKHVDFNPFSKEWVFYLIEIDGMVFRKRVLYPHQVYLENSVTTNSWDKLLDDLETCDVCEYFGYSKRASKEDYGCSNCQAYKTSESRPGDGDCFKRMFMDIASV